MLKNTRGNEECWSVPIENEIKPGVILCLSELVCKKVSDGEHTYTYWDEHGKMRTESRRTKPVYRFGCRHD